VEEEQDFKEFASQPNVADHIFTKMAPNIFGHADIKKALACLLFGGARKATPPPLPTHKPRDGLR
jgi:DNA replication licensing factor MCM5